MRLLRRLTGAARALVRRSRADAELDEELRSYLEAATAAKIAAGLSPDAARRAARAEAGSTAAVKDWVGDVGWETRVEQLWQDLRYAARLLRRSPGFTAAATLTLALGIGATTAIFTVIEAVILKPLPISDPDRVVSLERGAPAETIRTFTYPAVARFRDETAAVFDAVAASGNAGVRATIGAEARQVLATFVTEDYFDVLGIRASHGRFFGRDEHKAGAAPAVVLSDAFWRTRMDADPAVIGRTIRIADTEGTVVGVAPRGFGGLSLASPVHMFLPLMTTTLALPPANYLSDTTVLIEGGSYSPQAWLGVTARLRAGVSRAQADAFLSSSTIAQPRSASDRQASMRLVPTASLALPAPTQADTRRFAALLATVVSLVLLIGCANLAGLIVARNEQRRRETAVRLALGGHTGRVVRLFLAESVLLSVLGGAAGLLVASWMLDAMGAFVIPGNIRLETLQLGLTRRVLMFAGGAALFSAIVSGLLPALFGSRMDLASGFRAHGATGGGKGVGRSVLVAGQVAISLMLIVGAVLFGRSLRSALTAHVGVDAGRIAYATVSFWRAGYDEARLTRFNQTIVEQMSRHPGVERATFGALQLAENTGSVVRLRIDGVDRQLPRTLTFPCGPDYFATIGIPIVMGRALSADDGKAGAPPAVVVNEAFAQHGWPGVNPAGRRVIIHPGGPEFQVVGVARNGKYGSLSEEGRLALYLPWHLERRSRDGARVTLVVRSAANARGGVQSLQQQIRLADPGLPIFAAATLEDRIADLAMTQRIGASLLGWFSVIAFTLAVLGIYGLIAHVVTRRTNEIGVHIALGARPSDVVRQMMRQSLVPVVAGAVAGIGGAYALTRFATGFLFGIAPHDPLSFAAATAFLLLSAALASYLPARRAARIDPLVALRTE